MTAIGKGDADSLVARAVTAVRGHIRAHDLKVGDPLPGEGYFAEAIGVSRAVIREAFGALAALRLIDVANGRRARVSAIDGSVIAVGLDHAIATAQVEMGDIWEVRRTLELRTAALAARHRTDEEAAEILRLMDRIVLAAKAGEDVTAHDVAFHAAVARATHNALFVQIITAFAPLMEMTVPAVWAMRETAAERSAILAHHAVLANAIHRRDPVAAEAAMAAHFDANVEIGGYRKAG